MAVGILVASCIALRLLTTPDYVESADGYNFVRGVIDYSVPQQRPHWPGYPVYIWCGKLLALFIATPSGALHAISVLASSLSIIPIYGVAFLISGSRTEERIRAGLAAGLVWMVTPVSWLTGTEIYSDALAMLLAAVICWLTVRALAGDEKALLIASALGGFLLGVRLSYVPLLLPLLYALRRITNRKVVVFGRTTTVRSAAAAALVLPVAIWFLWQLLVTGAGRFAFAMLFHLVGHFVEWGNAVTQEPRMTVRIPQFLKLFSYYSLGVAWPGVAGVRLLATMAWILALLPGVLRWIRRPPRWPTPEVRACLLWTLPYLGWVFLIHDLSVIRYALPTAAALAVATGCALPRRPIAFYVLLALLVSGLAAVSAPLAALRMAQNLPQQISSFAAATIRPGGAVLVTDVMILHQSLPDGLARIPGVEIRFVKDLDRALMEAVEAAPRPGSVYVVACRPVRRCDAVLLSRFSHTVELDPSIPPEVLFYSLAGTCPTAQPST